MKGIVMYSRYSLDYGENDKKDCVKKRVGLYIRSVEERDSVNVQTLVSMLEIYSQKYGGTVIESYVDSKYDDKEPRCRALGRLLTDCEKEMFDEVLILRQSHISRSASGYRNIYERLKRCKVSLSVVENGNSDLTSDLFSELLSAIIKDSITQEVVYNDSGNVYSFGA